MMRQFVKSQVIIGITILVIALGLFGVNSPVLAASGCVPSGKAIIPASELGPVPQFGCETKDPIIGTIFKLVFGSLAVLSLIFVVIGGLRYTLSGGDSNSIATAKKTILYAVVGLILGVSVFAITDFIVSRVGS